MMKCMACHGPLEERRASAESPYAYEMGGLKNVYLAGIQIHRCPACNEETPIIPRVGDLHELIAKSLVQKKAALQADEIRFLRRNSGFQGNEFAALIGVTPTYYSKVENGHEQLSPSVDKLARIITTAASDCDKLRSVLLDIAKTLKPARRKSFGGKKPVFKLERNRWLQAVA